jgi:hypothetical protein
MIMLFGYLKAQIRLYLSHLCPLEGTVRSVNNQHTSIIKCKLHELSWQSRTFITDENYYWHGNRNVNIP